MPTSNTQRGNSDNPTRIVAGTEMDAQQEIEALREALIWSLGQIREGDCDYMRDCGGSEQENGHFESAACGAGQDSFVMSGSLSPSDSTDKRPVLRGDGKPVDTPLEFKDAAALRRYLMRGKGAHKSRGPLRHGRATR
jgi:hypothetical protein